MEILNISLLVLLCKDDTTTLSGIFPQMIITTLLREYTWAQKRIQRDSISESALESDGRKLQETLVEITRISYLATDENK